MKLSDNSGYAWKVSDELVALAELRGYENSDCAAILALTLARIVAHPAFDLDEVVTSFRGAVEALREGVKKQEPYLRMVN